MPRSRPSGRIDYLINNAGVAGAEDMVVDMSLEAWNHTLDANLVSNYVLMHHAVPLMKAQGAGYVLNVSSYFGGEKYLAVAYPNPRGLCRVQGRAARAMVWKRWRAISAPRCSSTPSPPARSMATGYRAPGASPACSRGAASSSSRTSA
ncbi:MAG: hypothetical protein KatS3mg120_0581 [Erythrobacter sp.]|nr:MAG: hypothetical protein KatS3mg120_0581 [Erythrobacter sp.]